MCQAVLLLLLLSLLLLFIYLFIDRGEGRKRERNTNVWMPLEHPLLGAWPTTQVCAPTENQTGDPLVCRLALNLLSHTSQGYQEVFEEILQTDGM